MWHVRLCKQGSDDLFSTEHKNTDIYDCFRVFGSKPDFSPSLKKKKKQPSRDKLVDSWKAGGGGLLFDYLSWALKNNLGCQVRRRKRKRFFYALNFRAVTRCRKYCRSCPVFPISLPNMTPTSLVFGDKHLRGSCLQIRQRLRVK